MTNKIGRNEKCPCGSGKKHKACCLIKTALNTSTADFSYWKLRQLEGTVIDNHLMPYAKKQLPAKIMSTAFFELHGIEEFPEEMDEEVLFQQLFIPWFLFNWTLDVENNIESFNPTKTIAWNYVKKYGNRLTNAEKEFITAMEHTYYSFYSILEVEFEKHFVVKDILLGTEHTVKERQGTHYAKRGNIFLGRILTLNEQTLFVGLAPYQVSARYQTELIQFRKWLIEENDGRPLDGKTLREELEYEIFDYYFEIITAAFSYIFPELCNTDGEAIQFSKSRFKLSISPEETLNLLMPLTLSEDAEERLSQAERDNAGVISRIEMPWLKKGNPLHQDWNNTLMGTVIIEQGKITLETNSEERTEQGKNLLKHYLGESVQFQQTLIESPEQMLKSALKSTNIKSEGLLQDPAVQAQINEMAKNHWENWFKQPVPALNNKTPYESAKTAEGRELLEALLLQYEDFDREQNNPFKADINYLKEKLSLN